jgi:hypothetical protein
MRSIEHHAIQGSCILSRHCHSRSTWCCPAPVVVLVAELAEPAVVLAAALVELAAPVVESAAEALGLCRAALAELEARAAASLAAELVVVLAAVHQVT